MTPIRRAGVLGRPISHSLSPVLHRAAYLALGLDWSYDAVDCGVDELADVLAQRQDWAGFSCTMPLKHAALEAALEAAPRAGLVGAANTLLPRPGGGWIAENTDVTGVLGALTECGITTQGPPPSVTMLGAGGTAQAALVALAELAVPRCTVLVRDEARAASLLATAARAGITAQLAPLEAAQHALSADLVVSTLPTGVADQFANRRWGQSQTVLDVVYDPWPTPLASAVAQAGATVISGALMLLHQAAAQVELMTGLAAPLGAMRAALLPSTLKRLRDDTP
jgi:shikimate dehydrogenase